MTTRLLLDTHVVIRWLVDAKRLSREQAGVLAKATERSEPVALSAITLLEIAVLSEGTRALKANLNEFFEILQGNPMFRILPLTYEVACEIGFLGALRDPADRVIVATARVHRLQLLTSDQRIVASGLVPVVE